MDGVGLVVRGLPQVTDLGSRAAVACACKALAFSEARCPFWTARLEEVAPHGWRGRIRHGKRAKRFAGSMLTELCVGCRAVRPRSPHPLFPAYLCSRCAAKRRFQICSQAYAVQQCQLAREPPLLSALDHSLACLPAAYPSMHLRLCFVDIYGTRFPARGQGGDPARQVRFLFADDVLRFRSFAQSPAAARDDARRRALIHARLPLLTEPYADMVRRHTGLDCSTPEDIDAALVACGPAKRGRLLQLHRQYVGLPGPPAPPGPLRVVCCPHCQEQPRPGERCVRPTCCGAAMHHRCALVRVLDGLPCPGCGRPGLAERLRAHR